MILFCKEFGKVSLTLLVGLQDFNHCARPQNDTMILFLGKNILMCIYFVLDYR